MDFGGNSKVSFHQFLEKEGWKVDIVDINDAINFKNKNIITAYFVQTFNKIRRNYEFF